MRARVEIKVKFSVPLGINDKYRKEGYSAGYDAGAADRWRVIAEDGLPTEEGQYLCTCEIVRGDGELAVFELRYCTEDKKWSAEHEYYDINDTWRPVAWMNLPAPYQGGTSE